MSNNAKYYTVDSARSLAPYSQISLGIYTPDTPVKTDFLNQIHPEGLSKHGYNYLYNPEVVMNSLTGASNSLLVGLIFELVRRSYFPEKPSRYQSLFACEHFSDAKRFRALLSKEKGKQEIESASIYEVITESAVHRGDMNLLGTNCSVLELYQRAHLYWSSEESPHKLADEPLWEILIPLPTLVGQRVSE